MPPAAFTAFTCQAHSTDKNLLGTWSRGRIVGRHGPLSSTPPPYELPISSVRLCASVPVSRTLGVLRNALTSSVASLVLHRPVNCQMTALPDCTRNRANGTSVSSPRLLCEVNASCVSAAGMHPQAGDSVGRRRLTGEHAVCASKGTGQPLTRWIDTAHPIPAPATAPTPMSSKRRGRV